MSNRAKSVASTRKDAARLRHQLRRAGAAKHGDLPRVLRRAVGLVRFAREAVGADASSIFLVDALELRGVASEWDWTRSSFSSALEDWPNVARALEDGEVRTIAEAGAQGAERGWFEPRGIAMTACVPIRTEDRAIGVLFFDFAAAGTLGEREIALLADVGRRCARAIQRDRAPAPRESSLNA